MKLNLPVILLKDIVILPNNDLRLEFENDASRNVIELSSMFHNDEILLVSQSDPLEEQPKINDLPKIGIVSSITHKLELPNGNLRVILKAKKRARVLEYLNLNNDGMLESIVQIEETKEIENESSFVKKIQKELDYLVKNIPIIGNGLLSQALKINKLDKLIDVVVPSLSLPFNRMFEYVREFDIQKRAYMLLQDMYDCKLTYEEERNIDLKVRKNLDDSQKEYFLREKLKTIKEELNEVSSKDSLEEEIRKKIDNLNAKDYVKERLKKELKKYLEYPSLSPEVNVIKSYIDLLLDLPWDNITIDNENLNDVLDKLNKTHYGLEDAKMRIIEYLAAKKHSPSIKSPIICLIGPPGTGKTSLAISIADALNRKFVKMSVGGLNDEAEIVGHRKTYLGSAPGKIIQQLKKAQSSNPVFLIDEIDKMTKDIKGDPESCLLSVLDPEQNKMFLDNYVEEYYDLSNVMFITTANYINNISKALRDRLEFIYIDGYSEYEKLEIVKNQMLDKICNEYNIDKLNFSDEIILNIIRSYTKESGVRELNRLISTIVRKKVANKVLNNSKINKKIKEKEIIEYLGNPKYENTSNIIDKNGIVNGLAYTEYGGDTLQIEANHYPGSGKIILTGSLGEVMQESAQVALSYVKANYQEFGINYELFRNDIHINAIQGAIPKDGPSAGVSLTTAIISSLKNTKVSSEIAMTGEITLHGQVLKIGGLKEKTIGAIRNGIKTIFIPYDNEDDLVNISEELKNKIQYIKVKDYKDIYKYIFTNKGKENNI